MPVLSERLDVITDFMEYRQARWGRTTSPFQREVVALLATEPRVTLPGSEGRGQTTVIIDWINYVADRYPRRTVAVVNSAWKLLHHHTGANAFWVRNERDAPRTDQTIIDGAWGTVGRPLFTEAAH